MFGLAAVGCLHFLLQIEDELTEEEKQVIRDWFFMSCLHPVKQEDEDFEQFYQRCERYRQIYGAYMDATAKEREPINDVAWYIHSIAFQH